MKVGSVRMLACEGCGKRFRWVVIRGRRRKWCSDRCRKWTLYSVPCEKCGELYGGIANGKAGVRARFCKTCAAEVSAAKMVAFGKAVLAEVEVMWAEGLKLREIAAEMGWTPGSTHSYVAKQRAKGAALPRRKTDSPKIIADQRRRGRELAQRNAEARAA